MILGCGLEEQLLTGLGGASQADVGILVISARRGEHFLEFVCFLWKLALS